MKIQFQTQHDSIKNFDQITLDDFSIITGANGSGKTHFLKGIHEGKFNVIAEGKRVPRSRIGYFDYNAFKQNIATQNNNSAQADSGRLQSEDAEVIDEQLQGIKNDFDKLVSNMILNGLTHGQMEQFENFKYAYIGIQNPNLLTPEKWYSVDNVIKRTNFNVPHDRDLWNKFFELLKEVIAELDAKYNSNRLYQAAKKINAGLYDINSRLLNSKESSLEALLKGMFEQYCEAKYWFEHKLTVRRLSGEEVDFDFEAEQYLQSNKAPWLLLNEILKEYGCNGYSFDEADIPPPPGRQQPFNINIRLRNEQGVVVPIEKLSSGEQTLFSLVVSLFAEKTSGSLPDLLLLDEIDASLHPSMCKQLLDVLKKVFVEQHQVKIIMVTHSPSTIAHANEDETYVMSVSEDGSKHTVNRENKEDALNALSSGFMTLSEGVDILKEVSEDIIILSEGKNKKILELAQKHFLTDEQIQKVKIQTHNNLSDGKLQTIFELLKRLPLRKKVVYVWDCDYEKDPGGDDHNNFVIKLKKHPTNKHLDRGIEASFDEDLFPDSMFEEKKDNARNFIGKGVKNKNRFFNELNHKQNLIENFSSFKPLFDRIKGIINK